MKRFIVRLVTAASCAAGGVLPALIGCSGSSALNASDAGKSTSYEAGAPGFDMEAVPVRGQVESGIDLYISVPPSSFVFERSGGGFRAMLDIVARLRSRSSRDQVAETAWAETLSVNNYEATQNIHPIIISRKISSGPGQYDLEVTVEDLIDGKAATRVQPVILMDLSTSVSSLGRIFLLSRQPDGKYLPEISFHIPGHTDSLQCAVDMYNVPPDSQLPVGLAIVRVRSDTSVPLPPYSYIMMTSPMSLGYGLIDFDRADTVVDTLLRIPVQARKETVLFQLPLLREGIYRFEVRVVSRNTGGAVPETTLVRRRYYAVNAPGFPKPATLRKLLDAAVYIAEEKEAIALRQAQTPEGERRKFEEFWLDLSKDRTLAAALIKKYYSRVEEANRLFTTVREGWRTDRGMLFIILGPPSSVSNYLDTQTWLYDFPGSVQNNTYTFKRVIREGDGLTVEDYILYRLAYYETFWDRMVARWREGAGP